MDVASFFYVSNDDAEKTPLGATASCDLDAQPLLPLHDMHLPDVEAFSRLQTRKMPTKRRGQSMKTSTALLELFLLFKIKVRDPRTMMSNLVEGTGLGL